VSAVGEREKRTQQRVIAFLTEAMGHTYLGHWQDRADNSNIEEQLLSDWLSMQGHSNGIARKLMSQFMPQWRLHRDELNRVPLAHADWKY